MLTTGGLSGVTALKYILRHDNCSKISIGASGFWIDNISTFMLSNTEQQRIISNISISDKPDYIITTIAHKQ